MPKWELTVRMKAGEVEERERERGSAMGTSLSITKKSEYKHKQECKLQMGKEKTQRHYERGG